MPEGWRAEGGGARAGTPEGRMRKGEAQNEAIWEGIELGVSAEHAARVEAEKKKPRKDGAQARRKEGAVGEGAGEAGVDAAQRRRRVAKEEAMEAARLMIERQYATH